MFSSLKKYELRGAKNGKLDCLTGFGLKVC